MSQLMLTSLVKLELIKCRLKMVRYFY